MCISGCYRQCIVMLLFFFFSSRRRHTRFKCDWSSDVCSSDLHRVGARILRRGEDRRDIEIAPPGRSRSDADRLIRGMDMGCVRVGVAEDRDGAKPKLPGRARDAAGDLAAVRDQDFAEGHITPALSWPADAGHPVFRPHRGYWVARTSRAMTDRVVIILVIITRSVSPMRACVFPRTP